MSRTIKASERMVTVFVEETLLRLVMLSTLKFDMLPFVAVIEVVVIEPGLYDETFSVDMLATEKLTGTDTPAYIL